MPWGVAAAAVVGGVVALSNAEDAEDAQHASLQQQAKADAIQSRMVDIGEEEWALYKEKALPLIDEMAANRKVTDRTAEEVAATADETKAQYAAGRKTLNRALNLSEDAGSSRSAAILAPTYMDEASAISRNIADARRKERARVEDTEWGRTLQTVGALQRLPQDATANLSGAAAGSSRNAAISADLSKTMNQNSSQAAYAGTYLGANAQRWMNRPQPTSGGSTPAGAAYEPYFGNQDLGQPDYGEGFYRHGGAIRPRRSYADGGEISGPGSGTSDSVRGAVKPGSFILSADTVRAIGTKKVRDMVEKAGVRPGEGGDDAGGVQVRLSNGEYQVPPEAVKFYGEEFFNKLQQKYHRPVLSDDGMANGGAIRKRGLPKSVEDAIFRSMPARALGRSRG